MYALGLHADGAFLKAALLRREEKKHVSVEFVRSFDLGQTKEILSVLQPLLADKKVLIVTGLDAWDILLREVKLQVKRKRELLSVLPFQCESLIPYPLEEAILIPIVHPSGKEGTDITLFAAKKESLSMHLEKMHNLQLDPEHVSATPLALWRYARAYLTEDYGSLLHLGQEMSCCLCFSKEKILFSQSFQWGVNDLITALAEDNPTCSLEDIDCAALDPEEFPHASQCLEILRCEWEKLRAFFEKKGLPLSFVFLGSIPKSLRLFLKQEKNNEDLSSYAIPIGLALDALHQDEHSLQFRQNSFSQAGSFAKRVKKGALCLLSIAVLSLVTWGSSHFFLEKKQKALIKKLELFREKEIGQTQEALQKEIRQWSKSLNGKKVTFPYQLTAPSVSEFLAWISSHPQLSQEGIDMNRIRYVLIKYPMLGKSQSPYQVKIELDFTASSATLARTFHESLLKGEEMVNLNHEVSWNAHDTHYQTSFILKEGCCP